MSLKVSVIQAAMLVLPPIAAISSLRLARWWQVALVLLLVAAVCWGLLLLSMSLRNDEIIAEFNRTEQHTEAEINQFNSDGASGAAAFLFGLPMFLVYGLGCLLVAKVGRYLFKRRVRA